jgi:hypothetical protein
MHWANHIYHRVAQDCNDRRLHSTIGYITPIDMLAGKQKTIHKERDRKLEDAREDRAKIRAPQAAARYAKCLDRRIGQMLGSNLSSESMPKESAKGVEAESLPPGTCHLPLATMR